MFFDCCYWSWLTSLNDFHFDLKVVYIAGHIFFYNQFCLKILLGTVSIFLVYNYYVSEMFSPFILCRMLRKKMHSFLFHKINIITFYKYKNICKIYQSFLQKTAVLFNAVFFLCYWNIFIYLLCICTVQNAWSYCFYRNPLPSSIPRHIKQYYYFLCPFILYYFILKNISVFKRSQNYKFLFHFTLSDWNKFLLRIHHVRKINVF